MAGSKFMSSFGAELGTIEVLEAEDVVHMVCGPVLIDVWIEDGGFE